MDRCEHCSTLPSELFLFFSPHKSSFLNRCRSIIALDHWSLSRSLLDILSHPVSWWRLRAGRGFFFSLLGLYKGIEVKNVQQQQQLAAGTASASQTVRNYLLSVFFPSSKHQRTVEEEEEVATRRHAMPILATSCDFVRHFNLIAPRKHRNHTRSYHFVAAVVCFSLPGRTSRIFHQPCSDYATSFVFFEVKTSAGFFFMGLAYQDKGIVFRFVIEL